MSADRTPAGPAGDDASDPAIVSELVAAQPQGGSLRAAADRLHLAALAVVAPATATELHRTAVEERATLLAADEHPPRSVPPVRALAATVLAACSPSAVAIWRGDPAIDDVSTGAALAAFLALISVAFAVLTERDRDRRPPADYPHVGALVRWVEAGAFALALVLVIARAASEGGADGTVIASGGVLAAAALAAIALGGGATARDARRRAMRAALRSTATFQRGAPADSGRGVTTEQAASSALAGLDAEQRGRLVSLETAALRALAERDGAPAGVLERAVADARLRVRPRPPLLGAPRLGSAPH